MAKQLQLRRGSTSQHASFTGAAGEVTVDTDKDVVVVHDGSTAGGYPLAPESATTAAGTAYLPAGTGAVPTDVQSKLRESVSVKDFGAVGDGVTDDTAAIQAADAAATGSVLFPAGTYKATASISKRLGISWVGDGGIQGAQSPQQAKTKIVFEGPTSGNAITIDGTSPSVGEANLFIRGIHFQAQGASQDLITGIYVGVKVCQIDACSFTNFATGIKHNIVETWITRNYFSSCPICIDSAGGESHIVDNHGFPQGGASSIAILLRGSATNVRGNKFFGDGGGAAFGCVVWGFGNIVVGNTFDAFTDVGILLRSNNGGLNTDNNIIVGNNVSGTGDGGTYNCAILLDTLAENMSGNVIVGNSIFNKRGDRSTTNGIRINATPGRSNNNNIVSGNSIANVTGAAITQTGVGTRTGNLIYDNSGYLTENSGVIAGYNGLNVNHGLAGTPSVVIATPESNNLFGMGTTSYTSSTFALLMRDNSGNLVPSGTPVNVRWYARM